MALEEHYFDSYYFDSTQKWQGCKETEKFMQFLVDPFHSPQIKIPQTLWLSRKTYIILPLNPISTLSSVQFSRSGMSDSLWPRGLEHTRPSCPSSTARVYANSCPLSQWCHPTISSSVVPFSSCPHLSQHQGLFKWVSSSHQVAKVLEFQLQHQSLQWTPKTDLL